jgi:PAS domain S-box-containing protein
VQIALDQSASGIVVYKAVFGVNKVLQTFRIVLVNRRAEQLLGYSRASMLGQTTATVFQDTTTSGKRNYLSVLTCQTL